MRVVRRWNVNLAVGSGDFVSGRLGTLEGVGDGVGEGAGCVDGRLSPTSRDIHLFDHTLEPGRGCGAGPL